MCTELCGLGHATMRAHVRVVQRRPSTTSSCRERFGRREHEAGRSGLRDGRLRGLSHVQAGRHRRPGRAEPRRDRAASGGKPLEDFIHESILDPDAVVAAGFQPDVMPKTFKQTLSKEQLDALVQYLVDGQKGSK